MFDSFKSRLRRLFRPRLPSPPEIIRISLDEVLSGTPSTVLASLLASRCNGCSEWLLPSGFAVVVHSPECATAIGAAEEAAGDDVKDLH